MALLFGVHEDVDPATTVARVGGNASRVFTPGVQRPRDLVQAASNVCGPSWAAGVTAVWSIKPNPADVASGAWKTPFTELGAFLRANPARKTVVVIWHEPENDLGQFGSPAGFVRLFNTCAGWLREANPSVTTAHAALAYRYGDGRDITDSVAPQWRTEADLHCVDVYSGRSNPLDTILPELSSYRRWQRFVARDSRWGVTERGWTIGTMGSGGTAATRAAAMAREAAWLATLPAGQQPEVYLLWSSAGAENDPGLRFDGDADAVARSINGTMAARAAAHSAIAAAAAAAPAAPPASVAGPAPAPAASAGNVAGPPAPARPGPQTREVTCPLCAGSGKYRFTV